MGDAHKLCRAASAILCTQRPLSQDFRESVATMLDALSDCIAELEMTEAVHLKVGQPFHSSALNKVRSLLVTTEASQEKSGE